MGEWACHAGRGDGGARPWAQVEMGDVGRVTDRARARGGRRWGTQRCPEGLLGSGPATWGEPVAATGGCVTGARGVQKSCSLGKHGGRAVSGCFVLGFRIISCPFPLSAQGPPAA